MRLLLITLLLAPVLAAQTYTVSEIGNDFQSRAYNLNMVYGSPLHFGDFVNPVSGQADTDEGVATSVPLMFSFTYFGQTYTHCNVSTNGFISFSTLTSAHPTAPSSVADSAAPNNIVAALWKDLGVNPLTANSQSVLYGTGSGAGVGDFEFHIMWQCWPDKGGSGTGAENNVIISLYESTGIIEVHYGDPYPYGVSQAYGFACGIEDSSGTAGYAATPGWMGITQQGKAYRFEPVITPFQITTANPLPNGTDGVAYSLQFDAIGGTPGYTWEDATAIGAGAPLPTNWSLSASGLLSAAAPDVVAGTYTFNLRVGDSASHWVSAAYTVTINPSTGGGGGGGGPGGGATVGGVSGGGGGGCSVSGAALAPWLFGLLGALAWRRKRRE